MKVLTIVVPTYNMEQYLNRCLDSLIVNEEQMQKLEVLIINDGSNDKSSIIAHEYQEEFPQTFRVIDKENGNYGSCINQGLKVAKGKYFRILDADDWLNSEGMEQFICLLQSATADIIFTSYLHCLSDGRESAQIAGGVVYGKIYDICEIDLLKKGIGPVVAMHGMTIRTDLLKMNNYIQQERISYTDVEFCFYSILYAQNAIFFDINLYRYFLGREGQTISSASSSNHYNDFCKVTYRLATEFIKNEALLSLPKQQLLTYILIYTGWKVYAYPLAIFRHPSIEMKAAMHNVNLIVKSNKILQKAFDKLTFRKFTFYKIWRITSFRIATIIGK